MIYEAVDIWNSPSLEHHGVKGMKWGVRKEPENPRYSSIQRTYDKAVYGRGGVRRINRHMNRGGSIASARSKEASRINTTRGIASVAGSVGRIAGGIGGAVGGYVLSKYLANKYNVDPYTRWAIQSLVISGSISAGEVLGRKGSQSITMLAGGYSPSKFRY